MLKLWSYTNPYDSRTNRYASTVQICWSHDYFQTERNCLDSHHACILYTLWITPNLFHLYRFHRNVCMGFYKLFCVVVLIQLDF